MSSKYIFNQTEPHAFCSNLNLPSTSNISNPCQSAALKQQIEYGKNIVYIESNNPFSKFFLNLNFLRSRFSNGNSKIRILLL